jgi:membrane protease YdiL (CAAX protease family)
MGFRFAEVTRTGSGIEEFLRSLTNRTMLIPLGFVMILLWLNGRELWGGYWEESTALAYIIMFSFILSIAMSQKAGVMWLAKLRFGEGVRNFWMGFLIMFAGLVGMSAAFGGGFGGASIPKAAVWPAIAITAFFVAPVEETIFRGVLKDYFAGWRLWIVPLGIIITSAMFAVTHYAVYGGAVMSLWWAFIMGCVFYLIATWKGVPSSTGAHTAYNLFVLGVLSGGIV